MNLKDVVRQFQLINTITGIRRSTWVSNQFLIPNRESGKVDVIWKIDETKTRRPIENYVINVVDICADDWEIFV